MSDEILIDRRFRLDVKRCWNCNRFHASEAGHGTNTCARCKNEALNEEQARSEKLQRRINSLRGVITRLGGKRGRR